MKKVKIFGIILVLGLLLSACGTNRAQSEYIAIDEELDQEREDVNSIQDAKCASDGKSVYMVGNAEGLIYRVDLEGYQLVVNCNDLLCDHEGENCSAKLPISESSVYSLRRNGDKVYALGNRLFEIGDCSKKEIGHGKYGHYGNQIIFEDYIAYFIEEDVVVVEDLEGGKEVQRFEDIFGYTQGNFYYKDYLYFVTPEWQLVRLNLKSGEQDVVETKGATRACVYKDSIYYIKVSADSDTNHLIKMNPSTLEKEQILEGVFYYNMLGNKLYYATYPGRELCCADMDGGNQEVISDSEQLDFGWLWAFPTSDRIMLAGADAYTFYVLDENMEIDFDKPLIREGW